MPSVLFSVNEKLRDEMSDVSMNSAGRNNANTLELASIRSIINLHSDVIISNFVKQNLVSVSSSIS